MEEGAKAVYTETEVDALIAAHAADDDAHHDPYTDTDAAALIATHAADDDAHHTKYTDAEAAAQATALIATHAANYGLHTKLIVKSADETVNDSNTFQDDDDLKFAIAANEVWAFIVLLTIHSSTSADAKARFNVPSGGTLYGGANLYYVAGGWVFAEFAAGGQLLIAGTGSVQPSIVASGVVVNGSTAGNFQLQWAQLTAEESDTIVKKGSCILAWKLA